MVATHTFQPYTYECSVEMYLEVYWSRFPQHPLFPYILDSQVIEKKVNEDGTETVIRKTKLDVDAPGWLKSLFGIQHSIFLEEATIDRVNRKVTIKTVNETLSSKATMVDLTVYTVHPDNPEWCQFTQTGTVELLVSVLGFQKKIEKYCLNLYLSRYNESRELDKKMIEEFKLKLSQQQQEQQATNITLDTTTTPPASTTDSVQLPNIQPQQDITNIDKQQDVPLQQQQPPIIMDTSATTTPALSPELAAAI